MLRTVSHYRKEESDGGSREGKEERKTFLRAERKGLEMKILKDTCFLFIGSL